MKNPNCQTSLIFLVCIPATLIFGSRLSGRWYYATSTLVVMELLIPFFMAFEGRKPQARELVILAVLCALAVASRVAIPIPGLKAIFGVIMIAGIAFGPESGFLVGAVSGIGQQFLYSQGPYTPWQMMAMARWKLAGFLFYGRRLPESPSSWAYSDFLGFCFVGPLLDSCTVFLAPITINFKNVMAIYLAGLSGQFQSGCRQHFCAVPAGKPMLEKLDGSNQYGMLRGMEKSA